MAYEIRSLKKSQYPKALLEIPECPDELRIAGELPNESCTFLSVVGTRKPTPYGIAVCEKLIASLSGLPIVIVSGLALGIDSLAHKAALKARLKTIAIPGSGLGKKVLYPATHARLAEEIVESGGALISEFADDFKATPWSFPQRNRIMAGISKAVLVIEAEKKSGTLITSKYATEYNRDVLAVPGSIFSSLSEGPHLLLRLGATPITSGAELKEALGFTEESDKILQRDLGLKDLSPDEKKIVTLLTHPIPKNELILLSGLQTHRAMTLISTLELKGIIEEKGGEVKLV